ncbi:hypothetical protein SCA6_020006 [Theobroma cacao]|uniref:Transcription repressor n=1 Tax=Theobroma cacao TaxID=3641 RepID=A0A061GES1_THECC|nr:Ovate family protein 5, putative [Theobroma cacao]
MMKWGRKKSSSSSYSSRLPSLSRVLPTAWLSTFKRMSINSEPKPAKDRQKGMSNAVPGRSSKFAGGGARFYGGDGEAFWRLSFGEDSADGKTSKSLLRSAWYDSDDELDFAPSSCQSCGSNATRTKEKEETQKFSNMACDVKKMKEFRRDTQILPDVNMYKEEKATVVKTPRSRTITEKDLKLKKTNERAMEEKRVKRQNKSGEAQQKSAKSVGKNTLDPEPMRTIPMTERENLKLTGNYQRKHQHLSTMNLRTSNLTTIKEDCSFTAQKLLETDVFSPEKLSKVKVKSDKQRKSLYMSRELPRRRMKQNNKVRVFSPRTASRVEICKIKALEDMKKAKLKMKAAKQKTISRRTGLENFAMVKCSFDPEKDFRDSMVEMIMEKRISQPEELEELLACYLTLNSDAYHDLIIKVFQQVWLDLDQASSDTDLRNEKCSCE